MKKLLSLALLAIVVLSFTSCKKDDVTPPAPNYVGTWTTPSGRLGILKRTYTANSYDEKTSIGIYQFGGAKGAVNVAGDLMTTTTTEVGVLGITGMIYYIAGMPGFSLLGGVSTPVTTKFTVEGNILTVMTDDNNDNVFGGLYDDASIEFVKE